jgi:hypothetical protein
VERDHADALQGQTMLGWGIWVLGVETACWTMWNRWVWFLFSESRVLFKALQVTRVGRGVCRGVCWWRGIMLTPFKAKPCWVGVSGSWAWRQPDGLCGTGGVG